MCMFRCWREIHHTRSARMQNTDCQSPEVPSASSYRWTVDADPDTAMPAMLLRLSLLHRKHKWVPAWMDFLPKLLTKCVKQQFCVSGCKQNLKGEMLFSIFFFFFFFSRSDGNTDLSTFGLEKLLKHLYQDLNSSGLFMMIYSRMT